MSRPRLLGAVLAGGESRRFGRDKAAEVVAGKSLAERAAETMAEVFDHVVIVSSREPTTPRWPHLPDRRVGQGPLAGIEAALLHAEDLGLDGAFVLACDLPLVDAGTIHSVLEALEDAEACAPASPSRPGIEPLCAVYRRSCLPRVTGALDEGLNSVHEVFTSLGGGTSPHRPTTLLNVNTRSDAVRAQAALDLPSASAGG